MHFVLQALLIVVPAIIAITLHEAAHGFAALALGDRTAQKAGRNTINPIKHIDRMGTIILPAVLAIGQLLTVGKVGFMFGWAKPVPVNAMNFSNPRRMMALVAAAGPISNFFLGWLGALAFHLLPYIPYEYAPFFALFLQYFILTNLVLGLFNLIPMPPLDGGRIAVGLLPLRIAVDWARLEKIGILIVLCMTFVLPRLGREFGMDIDPLGYAMRHLLPAGMHLLFQLAGLPQYA